MKYLVIVLMLLCSTVYAEQQYNAHENRWETVPDGSDWSPRYNAHENDWSYQPDDAQTEYNAYEGTWDWDSGNNDYDDYDY